MTEKSMSW